MTLTAMPVTGALAVISKVAQDDEGSALTLLQLALYEAVCDEADRIRPLVEKRFAQSGARRVQGALQHLAKRYAGASDAERVELGTLADELVAIGKDLTPQERFQAELSSGALGRDPSSGQFTSGGGVRHKILNLLGIATGQPNKADQNKAKQALAGLSGPDADSYTRLRALGQGLVATGQPGARAVGNTARVIADVGPEAQSALEPGLRRSAYRYRGTERRPSGAMLRQGDALAAASLDDGRAIPVQLHAELGQAMAEVKGYQDAQARQGMAAAGRKAPAAPVVSPLAGALLANPNPGNRKPEDEVLLARVSDFGALSLRKQVPDLDTAKVSLAAGKMPPSLGLLFDANGRLVSEAQGFNGDHYLPFDLKNLKRLKGGSYVRTRTTGGLTDEDIYTGLLTGARQLTVVSNSGVFTLEFDPSLRGGRRYSDKARQMVDRYAALTKVIGSGELLQRDFSASDMQAMRDQAYRAAGGDKELAERNLQEAIEAKRFEAKFKGVDEDSLMEQADAQARQETGGGNASFQQHRNEIFNRLKTEAAATQVKAYRLDGEGYATAMKALQTEFPYFIRNQSFVPMQEYLTSRGALSAQEQLPKRGGADIGYTQRNQLSPRARISPTETKEQSLARRTGRRPARHAGAPGEPAVAAATAAEGDGSGVPAAAVAGADKVRAEQAVSWEQAYAEHERLQKIKLNSGIKQALGIVGRVDGLNLQPSGLEGPDDPAVLSLGDDEYADWLRNQHDPYAVLTGPRGAEHRAKLRESLAYLQGIRPEDQAVAAAYPAERYQGLAEQLDTLGGLKDSFAPLSADPALQTPDPEHPRPQLFPEIVAAGPSPSNLVLAARHDPDGKKLEALAAQYAGTDNLDEHASGQISMAADELAAMVRWGQSGKEQRGAPEGATLARARQLSNAAADGSLDKQPEVKELLLRQKAWALAKAWKQAVLLTGEASPDRFGGAAPFEPPPEPGEPGKAAKRWAPVVIKHAPDSPIAKALAARLR